jgi:hypothetical protein
MSKYLDRLKSLDFKKGLPQQVSKVSEAGFEAFETAKGECLLKTQGGFETFETGQSRHVLEIQSTVRKESTQPEAAEGQGRTRKNALPREVSKVSEVPTRFSDLYDTEQDYARALIRYAGQDGLSLTVKDERLIIAISSKSDPDLLGELRTYEHAVIEALSAEPVRAFRPPIVAVPPFGVDRMPDRFAAAWDGLCTRCPPDASATEWPTAVTAAAELFGHWGHQIEASDWLANDIFQYPHGLAWFVRGSAVVTIGRGMAECQDGRIWRRARR